MNILFKLINKNEIEIFIKKIIKFCEDKNIKKNLKNFLTHKSDINQTFPDNIQFIMSGNYPKILLSNSRIFIELIEYFPDDYKKDIYDICRIKKYQRITLLDKKTKEFVKNFLKEDFLWN